MSGNHYSKQVMQLEAVLHKKMAQLSVLEAENSGLKQKECALQSCIRGIEGSVAATRAVLEAEAVPASADCNTGPWLSWEGNTWSNNGASADLTLAGCNETGVSSAGAQNVLEALELKEQEVQQALAQMGCCGSCYSELYGVRLLRSVTADPARAVALLNTPLPERRQYVKAAMQKLGLLLPKYDSSAPNTSLGSAKERLHDVLDELALRILLTTLMDPPAMRCSNMLVNLETAETETYPEDYWTTVATHTSATLTEDQKAALKMCWSRVKVNQAALTAQHSKLSERLEQLQQQQQQQQQHFEEQAAKLPLLLGRRYVQQMQQQDMQQGLPPASPASSRHSLGILQQQPLAMMIPQQQQQQQQQQQPLAGPSPVLASGQLVQDQQRLGSMQVHRLEEEIQEVERLLFLDLEGPSAAMPTSAGMPHARTECVQQQQQQQQSSKSQPEGLLSGLLQEQQLMQEAGILPQLQPQMCALPAMQQREQQATMQADVLPQQPQTLLQDQQQQQQHMCMLLPSQSPLMETLAQQQQLQQQQQQDMWVPQCSNEQVDRSDDGCTAATTFTACDVHQQDLQQHLSRAAAAPAGQSALASPVLVNADGLPGIPADAAAAAAAAADVKGSFADSATHTQSGVEEKLLPVASKEQRSIEQQLCSITEKMKLQHFCQLMQFHNTLTNKQLAELYVHSWPFLPDSLAACEALDELSW